MKKFIICRIKFLNNHIILNNLLFIFLNNFNYGGCVYISQSSINLKIEKSIFQNCSSTIEGGAIFFQSSSGSFSIIESCGLYCSSPIHSFSRSDLVSNTENINHCNKTSIFKCSPDFFDYKRYTLILWYGSQYSDSNNCSNNIMTDHLSGIGVAYGTNLNYNYCSYSYCHSDAILSFGFGPIITYYKFLNIINSTANNPNRFGILHINSPSTTLIIQNWIILKNSMTIMNVYSGSLIMENISMDYFSYVGTSPIWSNNCITNFIGTLISINLYNCNNSIITQYPKIYFSFKFLHFFNFILI